MGGCFRKNDCCDSCNSCGTGAYGTTTVAPPPVKSGEKIDAPKKMPTPAPTPNPAPVPAPKKVGAVQIDTPPAPIAPGAIPSIPVAPRVEVLAPAPTTVPSTVPVPRVEGDRRDPF